MPTSISDALFSFALALAASARVFTAKQLATHPYLRDRTQPARRAREFLRAHSDTFEKTRGVANHPCLWRLTSTAKRRYGLNFKSVAGDTQRREHWLGLGDLWIALTYAGGRPTQWCTEPHAQFDVMLEWQSIKAVVEYQRTPITTKQWAEKWRKRREWYKAQQFLEPVAVVLVVTTNQTDSTIQAPKGTIVCRSVDEVPRALRRISVGNGT
ncbi:hypothetical protein AAC03nite_34430 [Alicyclobacillus acidoterrestris]|nr:hypothetical protein AAC03nite_34430 [Alicyclobacillus acidoterrestris]